MNYFRDKLEGLPGIRPIRVDESTGSKMVCWYFPQGAYFPKELDGLPVKRFCEALNAEIGGFHTFSGANNCLHTHEFFKTFDLMHIGKPSRIAMSGRDARESDALCEPSEHKYCFAVPCFRYLDREWIDLYTEAVKKVIRCHKELIEDGIGDNSQDGLWNGISNAGKK